MRIIVCIKQVVDTSVPFEIDFETKTVNWTDGVFHKLNPADRSCIDRAVQLKEEQAEGTITAISIGPACVERALRECLSLGAETAVRIDDSTFGELDAYGTALVLSKAIADVPHDLVFCGAASVDTGNASVGPSLAEMLCLPHVSDVVDFEIAKDRRSLIADRQLGRGYRERVQCELPSLLTLLPRNESDLYPSLPMLIRALRSPIQTLRGDHLGFTKEQLVGGLNKTRLVKVTPPWPRPKKTFVPDSNLPPAERLRQLMAGGTSARKVDLLEGNPEELASKAVEFMRQQKLVPVLRP